ncbi:hypothetical protein QCA50_005664 [Cerrena zonata]|uniref:Nucleolar protein 16 n=1 Tax=Cerrena zonata TaxID=2478898 RepID=A0AAW0FUI3_9APHY
MSAPRGKGKRIRRAKRSTGSDSENKKDTYYARNTAARRKYQVQYNQVQRLTRRKVGKVNLAALRETKWQELKGTRPVFNNTICCRGGALDPDRSIDMKTREDKVIKYLQGWKVSLSDKYAYRSDPNGWVSKYVEELSCRIDAELRDVLLYLDQPSDVQGSAKWMEVVHGSRRMIALHHQERELILQGLDIPLLAFQSCVSIPYGNRVNRREFRRLYGF